MFDEASVRRDATGQFAVKSGSASDVRLYTRFEDEWVLDDGASMLVEHPHRYTGYRKAWYRLPDGTPVGMIHWSDREEEYTVPCICDIEVREEHRGQGHARRMIQEVEARIGGRLHTTGSFTPEGRTALEAKTPQHPWIPKEEHGCSPMTFVHDWDDLRAKH